MRLFATLFRRRGMPNGHIFRGKDRLIKVPTLKDLQEVRNAFAIEEKNMLLLRNPYLSREQSSGHSKELQKNAKQFLAAKQKVKEFKVNVTIESRLGHLRFKEPWE